MKKTKLLMPIMGATALTAGLVPALVGCNNSKEDIQLDVKANAAGHFGVTCVVESKSYKPGAANYHTKISWSTRLQERLYESSISVHVDGNTITEQSGENPNGYVVGEPGNNCMEIDIPTANFQAIEKGKKHTVDFTITLAQSYIDQYVKMDHWNPKGVVTIDGIEYEGLSGVPEENVTPGQYVQFEADLRNWQDDTVSSLIGDNGADYLYLAAVNTADKTIIPITRTADSINYGEDDTITSRLTEEGYLRLYKPEKGWGSTETDLKTLYTSIQFVNQYEKDNIAFVLCAPGQEVDTYKFAFEQTNPLFIGTEPDYIVDKTQFVKSADIITKITIVPYGLTDRLYFNGLTVYSGTTKIADDYVHVINVGKNWIELQVNQTGIVAAGGNHAITINTWLSPSEIDYDVAVDEWKDEITQGTDTYEGFQAVGKETEGYDSDKYVEFTANLVQWGNGQSIPKDSNIYLQVEADMSEEGNPTPDWQPISLTSSMVSDVYYGSNSQSPLGISVVGNYVSISEPYYGWGNSQETLQTLSGSILLNDDYKGLRFTVCQTKGDYYPVTMTCENVSTHLIWTDPTYKNGSKEALKGDDYVTTIYWIPNGTYAHLYCDEIPSLIVDGTEVKPISDDPTNGYSIVAKVFNGISIKIPKQNFTWNYDAGQGPNISVELDMAPSETSEVLQVDTWASEYFKYGGISYDAIHSKPAEVIRGENVEFSVQMSKWGDSKVVPPDEIYLFLFDTKTKQPVKIEQIGDSTIAYGAGHDTSLDYELNRQEGYVTIHKPNKGWPTDPGKSEVVSGWINFYYSSYDGIEFVIAYPHQK